MADNWLGGLANRGTRELIFAFVFSVLFIPGITGAATTPRWAWAAVVLPLLLRPVKLTTAHLCGLAFVFYAAISVAWSHPYDGLSGLFQLIILAEAFWFGSQLEDLKQVTIGFGLGIWFSSVVLCGIPVPAASDHAGLFGNSNVLGELSALVLVLAASQRIWWLVPGLLPALLLSHCRGALLAVAGAFAIWLWGKSRLATGVLVVTAGAFVLMSGSLPSIQQRLDMWSGVVSHLTFFGHGLGSFYTLYPLYSPFDTLLQRPEHLHNDLLELIFELGFVGAIAISAFAISTLVLKGNRAIKLCLSALAIEALFGFPLHTAVTAVLGGIIAGHAVRNRVDIRDMLASWRVSVCGRNELVASR